MNYLFILQNQISLSMSTLTATDVCITPALYLEWFCGKDHYIIKWCRQRCVLSATASSDRGTLHLVSGRKFTVSGRKFPSFASKK